MSFSYIALGAIAFLIIVELHNGFVMMRFNQNIKAQKHAADAKRMEMSKKRKVMFDLENHTKIRAVKGGKKK